MTNTTVSTVLRWSARILSALSIGVMLLFIFGEGFNPLRMRPQEALMSLFFPIGVLLGLFLAWRWESVGGALAVGSLAAFYSINWLFTHRFPGGPFFVLFAAPGALFVGAWLVARLQKGRA